MFQIRSDGAAATLKEAGADAEAELTTVRSKYALEIDAAKNKAKLDAQEHADRVPQINAERDERITTLQKAQAEDEARIARESRRQANRGRGIVQGSNRRN